VSHQPERKEKNCLNCGATVIGRYCHVCGQENVETKESFWSLAKHFVFDLLHFDGKFWHTLKYIFARPGFVASEYCLGKRMSYLHPIRMYLFTSAVFFLVFFSFRMPNGRNDILKQKDRVGLISQYEERLKKNSKDTSAQNIIALLKDTTREVRVGDIFSLDSKPVFTIQNNHYSSAEEYDSVQNSLPNGKKDSWLKHMVIIKAFTFNEKYKGRTAEGGKLFLDSFLHKFPYLLFLSLPFFALILKLLYIRRKNFYYSDHAIFTIYHFVLSFILMLILFGLTNLQSLVIWKFLQYVALAIFFVWPVYLLLEMKYFYRQGWLKTSVKFLLLNLLGLIVMLALMAALFLLAIFEL